MKQTNDVLTIAGRTFRSRLFLGTAGYPNRQVLLDALAASGAELATASIRRISLAGEEESLVDLLKGRVQLLPNTPPNWRARRSTPTGSSSR
jgi:thiazole synthase